MRFAQVWTAFGEPAPGEDNEHKISGTRLKAVCEDKMFWGYCHAMFFVALLLLGMSEMSEVGRGAKSHSVIHISHIPGPGPGRPGSGRCQ